jgi:hypothetical protein
MAGRVAQGLHRIPQQLLDRARPATVQAHRLPQGMAPLPLDMVLLALAIQHKAQAMGPRAQLARDTVALEMRPHILLLLRKSQHLLMVVALRPRRSLRMARGPFKAHQGHMVVSRHLGRRMGPNHQVR